MDADTIPQEAGINERAVDFRRAATSGQETVARLHYRGKPNRHLRGLRLSEPAERGARDPARREGRRPDRLGLRLAAARARSRWRWFGARRRPGDTVLVDGAEARVAELPFERG